MKNIIPTLLIFLCAVTGQAQKKQAFDLASFVPPAGWQKVTTGDDVTGFAITDKKTGTYCQIAMYASTQSKGSLQSDFESEWRELVVKMYKPTIAPELTNVESGNGWDARAGAAPFEFNGGQSAAMLVTSTGHGRCFSIVVLTNTNAYEQHVKQFLESVDLSAPSTNSQDVANDNAAGPGTMSTKVAASAGYHFSTTNFDDGWTSTAQEDWVMVVKGNITVLLHFNSDRVDVSSADHATISNNAWNTLVAPRYRQVSDYHVLGSTLSYERPYLISGDATDIRTGKRSFVSLFRKGRSSWVEIICPDRRTFIAAFGVDGTTVDYYADDDIWKALVKLPGYNKFAVDVSDLKGVWSNNFSAATQYVNYYTGASAGMDTYSSSEKFEFGAANTYKWNVGAASGFVGNIKYQGAKSGGVFSLQDNWRISFSDIEGRPRTFGAFFSCVKGARILWLDETGFGRVE